MVESKFVVFTNDPPHSIYRVGFWILFTSLFASRFTVHDTVTRRFTVH